MATRSPKMSVIAFFVCAAMAQADDKLVIAGNTSGNTNVYVHSLGGAGAKTSAGIRDIEDSDNSDGIGGASGIVQQKTHMTRIELGTDITTGLTEGYVGSWLQVVKLYNAIPGERLASEKYHAHGIFASLETGYGFMPGKFIDGALWNLEPQAQAIVSKLYGNDYTESNRTKIADGGRNSTLSHVGMRFNRKNPDTGFEPFTEANAWMGKLAADPIRAGGQAIERDMPGTPYQVKAGMKANANKSWQVWSHLGSELGKENSRRLRGNIGLRYQW